MTFDEWATTSRNANGSFAERNDKFIVEVARVGWDAAVKHNLPKISWDAYAKSYCIETEDGCYMWNPPQVSLGCPE